MRYLAATVVIATAFFAAPALAAEKCYDYVTVTDNTMRCDYSHDQRNGIHSGTDFAGTCTPSSTKVVQVEVECPPTGKWVNVIKENISSAAATCARVGLKPAKLDGKMCASGERRPNTGGDWASINYRYGSKGGRQEGGERVVTRYMYNCEGGSDNGSCGDVGYSYCYHNSGTQNNTNPDRVVAFYCDE